MRAWRWVVLVSVGSLVCGLTRAWAEDAPPVLTDPVTVDMTPLAALNDPCGTVQIVKAAILRLDPSYETVWNLGAGEFQQGVSASLYNVRSRDIPVAGLRVGVATNETLYVGIGLDVPGITARLVPQTLKEASSPQPLDVLWAFAGRHARVTPLGGYSFAENEPAYGVALGAAWGW